jgi:Zn finger protein HypA/HybF involved in hydrogenase expression
VSFVVTCEGCVGPIAEFPDLDGAEGLVRRHHGLVGHRAAIRTVLIPLPCQRCGTSFDSARFDAQLCPKCRRGGAEDVAGQAGAS